MWTPKNLMWNLSICRLQLWLMPMLFDFWNSLKINSIHCHSSAEGLSALRTFSCRVLCNRRHTWPWKEHVKARRWHSSQYTGQPRRPTAQKHWGMVAYSCFRPETNWVQLPKEDIPFTQTLIITYHSLECCCIALRWTCAFLFLMWAPWLFSALSTRWI